MSLDKKILSEIERYKSINQYINEQAADVPPTDVPPADLGALAPPPGGGGVPPPPAAAGALPPPPPEAPTNEPIDLANDPDVEKLDDEGNSEGGGEESGSEELDITELVDSQKNIETKQEEYFNNLFGQLNDLQSRLGEMDQIMNKLNSLEAKIEKYREKTPQEKLELRTYDSYPFNQKLSDFFDDKSEEMEKTGKNDYVLTSDQVTDINVNDIKNSFQPGKVDNYDNEFKK
jgi:molecular chaperone GrpE (heat shock protein)